MPANLTPEYHDAEERFKEASSTEDKVKALEEMLRVIPKHKGTEKMQAELKRRLSRLRKDFQKEKASGVSRRPFYYVPREGAGRVVVTGPANSGKSTIIRTLTHARPEVAPYPFTTRIPQPGMMKYEDIQVQLVDMPPLTPETIEPWHLATIEQADVVLLVFDMLDTLLLDQTEFVSAKLEKRGIVLAGQERPRVEVLGNKIDLDGAEENFQAWKELYEGSFRPRRFSSYVTERVKGLKRRLFRRLDKVRVYTKPPSGKAEKDPVPYVLARGSTVLDAAAMIHRDLARDFKFARIWGKNTYDGQRVERDHRLEDGDLLEVHT